VDAKVGGDVLTSAAAVGHQDHLQAVPEFPVVSWDYCRLSRDFSARLYLSTLGYVSHSRRDQT
jgi:hypothetical protein